MTARARLLLAVLGGLLLFWLSLVIRDALFERVDEVETTGFRGVAAVNDLLALERLLKGVGVDASSRRGFALLPPDGGLLVVATPRRSLGDAGATRLLDWAARGGHLVLVPAPVGEDLDDPLLEPLDILLHRVPPVTESEPEPRGVEGQAGDSAEGDPSDREREGLDDVIRAVEEVLFAGEDLLLRHVGPDEPLLVVGEPTGARLVRIARGAGVVTVIADGSILTNARLGEEDNALEVWRALMLDEPPAAAVLIHRDRRPAAEALLAGRAKPVVAALAALVLAWLWKAATSFGPRLPSPEPERRNLAEHVRAAGAWQWKCGAQRALIDAVREALQRKLRRGHDESLEDLALRAAEDCGADRRLVGEALAQRAPTDRLDFARVVRTLEDLRRTTR